MFNIPLPEPVRPPHSAPAKMAREYIGLEGSITFHLVEGQGDDSSFGRGKLAIAIAVARTCPDFVILP